MLAQQCSSSGMTCTALHRAFSAIGALFGVRRYLSPYHGVNPHSRNRWTWTYISSIAGSVLQPWEQELLMPCVGTTNPALLAGPICPPVPTAVLFQPLPLPISVPFPPMLDSPALASFPMTAGMPGPCAVSNGFTVLSQQCVLAKSMFCQLRPSLGLGHKFWCT